MANLYLDVVIEVDGTITINGQNFQDASCEMAMAVYMKELGEVTHQDKKKEYYGHNINVQHERSHQRS